MVKTGVDGTTTCVTADECATNNVDGSHFRADGDTKCILCSDDSDSAEANKGTPGCKTCKKNGAKPVCSACLEGYFGSNTCTSCGANCATCTEGGNNKCSTCKPGYFKQTSDPGTCTSCDDADSGIEGCATCTFSTSLTCNSCKPNYRQSGSGSITCTKACEDDSACGGTAGACEAIVVDGDGSVKHYCSQCRQQ